MTKTMNAASITQTVLSGLILSSTLMPVVPSILSADAVIVYGPPTMLGVNTPFSSIFPPPLTFQVKVGCFSSGLPSLSKACALKVTGLALGVYPSAGVILMVGPAGAAAVSVVAGFGAS